MIPALREHAQHDTQATSRWSSISAPGARRLQSDPAFGLTPAMERTHARHQVLRPTLARDSLSTVNAKRQDTVRDVEPLMARFRAFLARQQLKSTKQRDLIAKKFFTSPGHISIEELLGLAREENPRVGYATVYRTLKLLKDSGLAAERQFGGSQTMYETAGEAEHHDHLICMECGHVIEFVSSGIERAQERVARSFGFNIVRHKHELYGLCPKARGIEGGSCPREEAERSRS
jgi:Fur family ferric uptake transcriptional regulator